ncbi:GWT1-domain-containing protein [Basidiobolus meristosporus CBS 931.73]|uniref:GPI-anchored wall transfer protein n=1 Tax=Basidiobolus meristosporus CBS 931.73 TaxID=1314790 RepID=A0A1Y1Y2U9_9FUNG|nr:GWT1-domain-containing protein [Basidiobolus meristosporus CBS 931.73]|eukprot:ORX91934.1 GWT1-domain-containing protein [Basidiobolus meristosporus CBS 931.73]
MTPEDYREAKIQWVTGQTGSSISEINVVIFVNLCAFLLWTCCQRSGFPGGRTPVSSWFAWEFILFPVISLTSQTFTEVNRFLIPGLLLTSLGLYLKYPKETGHLSEEEYKKSLTPSKFSRKSYLSVYRSLMMLLTCVDILAVDFPIFPRRFAKVETFGTSMMDLGVGSFVFSAGVVAAKNTLPELSGKVGSFLQEFLKSLLMVKGIEYQEHVTEYGVHWNFFITLGFLPIFVTISRGLAKGARIAGPLIILGYQLALWYGVEDFILNAPRVDLLSMNREGVFSFLGYLSIFLIGLETGSLVLPDPATYKKRQKQPMVLLASAVVMWTVFHVVRGFLEIEVSRRMANLPYVLWVVAFNLTLLLGIMSIERCIHPNVLTPAVPKLLDSLNQNGLTIFLVANLLTGAINISMQTIYMAPLASFLVCSLYLLVICSLAVGMKMNGIRLR